MRKYDINGPTHSEKHLAHKITKNTTKQTKNPKNELQDLFAICESHEVDTPIKVLTKTFAHSMGEAYEAIVIRLFLMNTKMEQAMHRHVESLFNQRMDSPTRLIKFYHLGSGAQVTLFPKNPELTSKTFTSETCSQLAVSRTHLALTTLDENQHKNISQKFIFKLPVEMSMDENTLCIDLPHELQGWVCIGDDEKPVPYRPSVCRAIEAAYADGDRCFMLIEMDKEYKLDFKESTQITVATKERKRILRNGRRSVSKPADRFTKDWPQLRMSIKIQPDHLQLLREELAVSHAMHFCPHIIGKDDIIIFVLYTCTCVRVSFICMPLISA